MFCIHNSMGFIEFNFFNSHKLTLILNWISHDFLQKITSNPMMLISTTWVETQGEQIGRSYGALQ